MRIKDSTGEAEITLKTLHDDEGVTSQEESPGKRHVRIEARSSKEKR